MINATLLLATSLALGQNAEPSAYEHLKDLECFVGTWEAESVLPESSGYSETVAGWAGKPTKLRMHVKWATGKSAQVIEYRLEIPGEVTIVETALRGWDQTKNKIVSSSFTTHSGIWSETTETTDGLWVSTYAGYNLDGEHCTGKRTCEFMDSDTLVMKEADAKTGDKPVPDMKYLFKRVAPVAASPAPDDIKDLEFLVGQWEAQRVDGSKSRWTFEWTPNQNVLENVLTSYNAAGEVQWENRGMLGWDKRTRQLTNRCFTQEGNAADFIWQKNSDGVWQNWTSDGGSTFVVARVDDDSWRLFGNGLSLVYQRMSNGE